jgi:hypothetical protein
MPNGLFPTNITNNLAADIQPSWQPRF